MVRFSFRIKIGIAASALLISAAAHAQSSPGLYNGQVPTGAQWNSYFAAKQDFGAGTVSATSLAPGAASSNVGTLGGDLGGTLPNPTVTSVTHVAAGVLGTAFGGTGLSTFTRSGNTTAFVTQSGSIVAGDCPQYDSNGNLIDSGAVCGGGGGGSGTVTSVGISAPSGFSISGSPVTAAGTLALSWSGTIPNAQVPSPTTGALGGIKALSGATSHDWVQYIDTSGVQNLAQPACADVSDAGTICPLGIGTGLSSSGGNLNITSTVTAGGPTGSSTTVPVITWNAQGQLTAVSSATLATTQVALLQQQVSSGTSGQSVTGSVTIVCNVNTTVADPDSIVSSLTSNQFTLAAGTYEIKWTVPFEPSNSPAAFQSLLYNSTASSVAAYGISNSAGSYTETTFMSSGSTILTLSGSTGFYIELNSSQNGAVGVPASLGTEIYTTVEIIKLS